MSETNFTEQDRRWLERLEVPTGPSNSRTKEAITHAVAEIDSLRRENERLKTPPDAEAWSTLIKLAYADGGDGVQRIHSITSEFCQMRDERDSLRVALGEQQASDADIKQCRGSAPTAQQFFAACGKKSSDMDYEKYMDFAQLYADFIVEFEKKGGDLDFCTQWPTCRIGRFTDH